jgi:hypothetical protein
MISVPGAVGNALANATGVEYFDLPLDAERVFLTLKRAVEEQRRPAEGKGESAKSRPAKNRAGSGRT